MPVKISNLLASGPVLVPLNTGTTLHLSPGETSQELPDVEVADNAKIEKLLARGVINVERLEDSAAPADETAEPDSGPPEEEPSEPAAEGQTKRSRKSTRSG